MEVQPREVTVPCPRCGQPFVLSVGPLDVGYETDVVGWACDCDLTEDEYEDLCDQAVATAEAAPDGPGRQVAPTPPPDAAPVPHPRPWWRRVFERG